MVLLKIYILIVKISIDSSATDSTLLYDKALLQNYREFTFENKVCVRYVITITTKRANKNA